MSTMRSNVHIFIGLFLFISGVVLLAGCTQQGKRSLVPEWIPIPQDVTVASVQTEGTKTIVALTTELNVQELHGFYNQAFNEAEGWKRLSWEYQPARNTIDLTAEKENTEIKIKVFGNFNEPFCKKGNPCILNIIGWKE